MLSRIVEITKRVEERSKASRENYLSLMDQQTTNKVARAGLSCGNLAHAIAGCALHEKDTLKAEDQVNVGIINSYNDMLSAHKTFEKYPDLIRAYATQVGATAQVAAGVPAMCDGVTQGQDGMELSLLSRDVIAMATAIGLSHNMFDAGMYLGICDKIVPGMLVGALRFGHLPGILIPGGPMPTGITNDEKAKIRRDYAAGKVGRKELLEGESAAYHSAGTCTFFGTANSNQMLMEVMGLHLPGSSFIPPDTDLRNKLTKASTVQVIENARNKRGRLADIVSEKSIVNGVIGLLATGGSTNHVIHLPAIAAAAGVHITLEDISDLSECIPLLARVYPNGKADVNDFHNQGGVPIVIATLREHGLIHDDVETVVGSGLEAYTRIPELQNDEVVWNKVSVETANPDILRQASNPFSADGGLKILKGNLGSAVVKTSAIADENKIVKAPAVVFTSQAAFVHAFKQGELNKDCVVVVTHQGPRANGMPELHQFTPMLSILQNQGYAVALVTDGRMSGASGKVPAAIHVSPEAMDNGNIARVRTGDVVEVDGVNGTLTVHVDEAELMSRDVAVVNMEGFGTGRELFTQLRNVFTPSTEGASIFNYNERTLSERHPAGVE